MKIKSGSNSKPELPKVADKPAAKPAPPPSRPTARTSDSFGELRPAPSSPRNDAFVPTPKSKPAELLPPAPPPPPSAPVLPAGSIVGTAVDAIKRQGGAPVEGPKEKLVEPARPAPTDPAAAAEEVEGAREKADDAREAYEAKKAELDSDLASMPGIDPETREAYEREFWAQPGYAEVKASYDQANADLSACLEKNAPVIEASGSQAEVNTLCDAYSSLAHDPAHAQAAVDFCARIANNSRILELDSKAETRDLRTPGSTMANRINKVLETATPAAQAHALALAEQGDRSGLERLAASVEKLSEAKEVLGDFADACGELAKFLRDPTSLTAEKVKELAEKFDKLGPIGHVMAVVGIVQALATAADSQNGDLERLAGLLSATEQGLNLVAGALATLAKGIEDCPAGQFAKWAARYAPFVGALVRACELGQAFKDFADAPGGGAALQVFGSFIGLVGSGVSCIPVVGEAVGTVIEVLGDAVSLAGKWLKESEDGEATRERKLRLLQRLPGMTPELAAFMVDHPDACRGMQKAGLSHDEMCALIQQDPAAVQKFGDLLNDMPAEAAAAMWQEIKATPGLPPVGRAQQPGVLALIRQLASQVGDDGSSAASVTRDAASARAMVDNAAGILRKESLKPKA